MSNVREFVKRTMPPALREVFGTLRHGLTSPPPVEIATLHAYEIAFDPDAGPRLTLVIPSIAPKRAFGGVVTGLDIFLALGAACGVALRLVLDEHGPVGDRSLLDARARALGLDPGRIHVVPRQDAAPRLNLRRDDIFMAYNTWITLNLRPVLREQARHFGVPARPCLHLIQDYEPQFYPFSSTHLLARQGFDHGGTAPKWAIFNTTELFDYFRAQGHAADRSYVFEPQIASGLRAHLASRPEKTKRILVYGRPAIARNCYPAVLAGLKLWARRYPEFADWQVVSAGAAHRPVPLTPTLDMRSVGKLPLADYAAYLGTTAVGLSLMASPHPSYPPLEMAHFGVLTVTNRYANKDLATSHDNILSIGDVDADTIADTLAEACRRFEAAPQAGWSASSHRPSFTATEPYPFLDEIARALESDVWNRADVEDAPPRHATAI